MTDDTSRRTNRAFDLLESSLDVVDEKPDLDTIMDAAFATINFASDKDKEAPDAHTGIDLLIAKQLISRATETQMRSGNPESIEHDAAGALELAITALRRCLLIEAGMIRPLTEEQVNGRAASIQDLSHLSEDDQRVYAGWIAEWRALPPWTSPKGADLERGLAQAIARLDSILDKLEVPTKVRRWVDRRMADRPRTEHQSDERTPAPRPIKRLEAARPVEATRPGISVLLQTPRLATYATMIEEPNLLTHTTVERVAGEGPVLCVLFSWTGQSQSAMFDTLLRLAWEHLSRMYDFDSIQWFEVGHSPSAPHGALTEADLIILPLTMRGHATRRSWRTLWRPVPVKGSPQKGDRYVPEGVPAWGEAIPVEGLPSELQGAIERHIAWFAWTVHGHRAAA